MSHILFICPSTVISQSYKYETAAVTSAIKKERMLIATKRRDDLKSEFMADGNATHSQEAIF